MSDTSPVSLVCCDLAGTIVSGGSTLEKAFAEAIATQGVVPGTAAYARSMVVVDRSGGLPPRDVMHALFAENDAQAQAAYMSFERSYRAVVDRFGITIVPGALDVVAKLSGSHVQGVPVLRVLRADVAPGAGPAGCGPVHRPHALPGGRTPRLPLARSHPHRCDQARHPGRCRGRGRR